MKKDDMKLVEQLKIKSQEAFIMGLEIFNKPTLKYRVEGFVFFICNAWELMLKAKIINDDGLMAIYYKRTPTRTISLADSIKKVFTNDKDPLRKNLEKILELRNTSTHYITEEYGLFYAPLFQSCVLNFRNKFLEYHNIDIAASIPDNFLTLSINVGDFTDESIKAKYTPDIALKMIERRNDLAFLEAQENNYKFSISIHRDVYLTKNKNSADITVAIDSTSESKAQIIKELKDPSNTHNLAHSHIVDSVNKKITSEKIRFETIQKSTGEKRIIFNKADLDLFIKFYDLKNKPEYSYAHKMDGRKPTYSYSPKTVDFIIEQIKKDPTGIITSLRERLKR